MASKDDTQHDDLDKYALFVRRFVHDVLVYTSTKCGLPETCLPVTDCAENVYHHADFLKVAGASVLRASLVMRDKWMQMFKSRRNSCGFNARRLLEFLMKLVICSPVSRKNDTQSLIELLLASCNEIMLYFHLENIEIDFNKVIRSVTVYIIGLIGLYETDPKKLEDLFENFDDISGYTEWITDFIINFAIPYGSRGDVSDRFLERVREKYEDDLKKLKDGLRFLPHNLFLDITGEGPENLAKPVSTPNKSESVEPPTLPTSSKIDAVGGKESLGSQSTCAENVSEDLAQSKQSSLVSSDVGIEQDLEKISLDVKEASQEMQGATSKRKTSRKRKSSKKKASYAKNPKDSVRLLPHDLSSAITDEESENATKSTSTQNKSESVEPPILPTISEIDAVEGNKSFGSRSTCTEDVSDEHFPKSKQDSKSEQKVISEQSENLSKPISTPSDSESVEPPNLPTSPDIGAVGGNKSLGSQPICTEDVSEHFPKSKQDSKSEQRVTTEISENLSKPISTPSSSKSVKPTKLPTISEIGAMGEESLGSESTSAENVSEDLAQSSRVSSDVGIEQDLEEISLDVGEDSQEMYGGIRKRKTSRKRKSSSKKKESYIFNYIV